MDAESRKLCDDLIEGRDVVEIEYLFDDQRRMSIGVFRGWEKDHIGEWCIIREARPDVRMIDVLSVKRLKFIPTESL